MEHTLKYIKTDKNGTEYYYDYTCRRCGGAGYSDKWCFTGKVCYECGGKGVSPERPQIVKKYTPEYAAKLDEKREARRIKQEQELRAKAEEVNAEFLARYFPNGKMYIVWGGYDRYTGEELKAAGVKLMGAYWYFTEVVEGFELIEVTPIEVTYKDRYGVLDFHRNFDDVIWKKHEAMKPVSEYVGQVGEKITIKATYDYVAWFDGYYGKTYIHNFKTDSGDVLVWKTSKGNIGFENGEQVEITATVSGHNEYKGEKQTTLTRCKFQ